MVGRIFILTVIAASCGAGAWYMDLQKKQKDLDDKQSVLAIEKSNLESTNVELAKFRDKLQALKVQSEGLNALAESKAKLTEEIIQFESARETVQHEFTNEVQAVRLKYTGMLLPEIRLKNGTVLQGVRFQTITDSDVRIAHNFGVSNVQASNLPADLQERFRINMVPMKDGGSVAIAGAGTSAPSALSQPPAAPLPTAPASNPPAAPAEASNPQLQAQLQAQVREMEKKMAEYGQLQQSYQRQVQDYRQKDEEAKILGKRPAYREVIPKIDKALGDLSIKVAELNTKIGDLKIQMENAKAVPN